MSTLLPLSENKISFSSSKSLAAAELYLYSIVGKNKLTASQIKELKNYADLLTKASVKTQQTVTSTGKKFYQQFNFNSIFAEKQVTFDIKGALSIEDYVYHSLIQLGKTNLLSYEQDKLDNYIKKLTDLKKGIGVISSFQEDAKNFYTYSIGLSEKDASNQLEMDLLQIGLKMKASIYADLTKEIESYLTEMARTYQAQPLTYQQEFLRWSYAFNLDYVRKYPQYSWTLTDATSKGIAFYKSLGLTEESAMQQTQLDVAWIKEK